MNTLIVTTTLLMLGADIVVNLAPDQPIPHVYPDDPLIVEFLSPADAEAQAEIEIERVGHPAVRVTLGPMALRAGRPYWAPVEDIPTDQGRYRARIRLTSNGTSRETTHVFCRIDRPLIPGDPAFSVSLPEVEDDTLDALRAIPIGFVRLNGGDPGLEMRIEKASEAGFQVVVALDALDDGNYESIAQDLSARFADQVVRWEVDTGSGLQRVARVAAAIRRGGSRAPITPIVSDEETLVGLVNGPSGTDFQQVVYRDHASTRADLEALMRASCTVGREKLSLITTYNDGNATGPELVRRLLINRAAGVVQTEIAGNVLYADGVIQEGYAYLSALTHRLEGATYVGELTLSSTTTALVFRQGRGWITTCWSAEEHSEIDVPLGSTGELQLTDALNNPLPVPPVADGAITLSMGSDPVYLTGSGGDVVVQAALSRLRKEAERINATDMFHESFPDNIKRMVASLAESDEELPNRLSFFALLQLFPAIEMQCHEGSVAETVAVPVLAGLAEIARSLCVIEQERSEPFLEPLSRTLSRCSGYQTLYLTNTASTLAAAERGEWLLAEVSRLAAEANQLDRDGYAIEACAVATMAEWRARALEFMAGNFSPRITDTSGLATNTR